MLTLSGNPNYLTDIQYKGADLVEYLFGVYTKKENRMKILKRILQKIYRIAIKQQSLRRMKILGIQFSTPNYIY